MKIFSIKKLISLFLVILVLIVLSFFGLAIPDVNIEKSDNFDGKKFKNIGEDNLKKSLWKFLKWRIGSKREEWPEWVEVEQHKVPQVRVDKGELSVTFINHATTLIQMDGVNILTDPVYSKRTSPVSFAGPKRVKLPGVKFVDLPKIDIILISHNHYDSYDVRTLKRLIKRDNPKIFFGLGNSTYMNKKYRKNMVEFDWGDSINELGLKITFLRNRHWAKRNLFDTNRALWGAFVIEGKNKVYFGGDTGFSSHFKEAGDQFGKFDLALIPIGAYAPRWFMSQYHIDPKDALRAHMQINSEFSVGIHFGTFQLTNEAIDDPIKDLAIARKEFGVSDKKFIAPYQGQTVKVK